MEVCGQKYLGISGLKSLDYSLKILPFFWENTCFCLVEAMEMRTVADVTKNKIQS